ncbi:MAG TPA: RraA family protein [Candidatus Sulfotelmatobacter sp.]|nr:RraA family protein [Candidatus Sulfotelmatobacter sp.]
MSKVSPIPEETMAMLRDAGTGVVSDALALAGVQGGVEGIHPARGFEDVRLVGPVCTMQFGLPRPDTPKLTTYGIIENLPPGAILVIDAKGLPVHFAGDNVGSYAKSRGLTGVVVYGAARDVGGWRRAGMPLYCTGLATKDKPSSMRITGFQVPVEIAEVLAKPDDVLVADEDGIVIIPRERLEAVLEKVKLVCDVEACMQEAIVRGATGAELSAIIARKKPK